MLSLRCRPPKCISVGILSGQWDPHVWSSGERALRAGDSHLGVNQTGMDWNTVSLDEVTMDTEKGREQREARSRPWASGR